MFFHFIQYSQMPVTITQRPEGVSQKLLVLSDQQFDVWKVKQQILTSEKREPESVWH